MARRWTKDDVLELARGFQPACVLTAAAELGVFDALAAGPVAGVDLASMLRTDQRATIVLADSMVAMELLSKRGQKYSLAPGVGDSLTAGVDGNVLSMVRHLANCLRNWAQLAAITKAGRPPERATSVRGPAADREAFIEAMNDISTPIAASLIEAIGPPEFTHLLDLGGGPATWTIAMLRAMPEATAVLFDLPEVIPIARRHVERAGMGDRVSFVAGDFDADETLPGGADLAWVSAIVHQNSRRENRHLFGKVHAALTGGGQILIRDVVMDDSHTSPAAGAMFAINMLVNTPAGGTFTFAELNEDLLSAGFSDPILLRRGEFMDSVIQARKS